MTLNATTEQFTAENAFYRLAPPHRIGKFLAQYEAFRRIIDVPGEIVECGVFKGSSLYRFASLRPAASQGTRFDPTYPLAPKTTATGPVTFVIATGAGSEVVMRQVYGRRRSNAQ